MYRAKAKNEKVNRFRTEGKYCDVNIRMGTKDIPVHKVIVAAASEYFEKLFNENPDESTIYVTLQSDDELKDVKLFEEVVLPFIYTDFDGWLVDEGNVVQILRLSALFNVQSLEDHCLQFIRENSDVLNILNLFKDDNKSLKKPSWIPALSAYIMAHFDKFYSDKLLMDFSFEDFKALLGARFFLSPNNEDKFLNTIIKWCHNCEEERREYFNYLINCTNFPNMSARYMKYLLKNFCSKAPSCTENSPSMSTDDIECGKQLISELHMYVVDDAEKMRVYSANKTTAKWNVSCIKKLPSNDSSYSSLASLEVNDRLYTLDYSAMKANSFNSRSNVLFSSDVRPLKPPPLKMQNFSMCSLQGNIFVNNYHILKWENLNIAKDVYKWSCCGNKGITQGIFEYNIVLDEWFQVPTLTDDKLNGSSIIAHNNVLYLVEGSMPSTSTTSQKSINIRALDIRKWEWQTLTKNTSTGGDPILGCAHDGKIYVGSRHNTNPRAFIGIYDLRANRWEEKFQEMNYINDIRQLLAYENHVWAFGDSSRNDLGAFDESFEKDLCEIEVFNPVTQHWSQSSFSNVNQVTEDGSRNVHFKNVFIFKSTLF